MPGMACHPDPDGSGGAPCSLIQRPPQIFVLDRLLVGGFPALFLPAHNPFRRAVHHIAGVGMDGDGATASSAPSGPRSPPSIPCGCWWWLFSPPDNSFSCWPVRRIAPQPPGPGLPEQAPSVKIRCDCTHKPVFPRVLHLDVEAQLLGIFPRVLGPHQGVGIGIEPVISRVSRKRSAAPRISTGRAAISASRQRPLLRDRRRSAPGPW